MDVPIRVQLYEPDETRNALLRAWLGPAGLHIGEDYQVTDPACESPPDVVLFDLGPTASRDLRAIAGILATTPSSRVILLHCPGQERTVLDALRRGAWGELCWEGLDEVQLAAAVTQAARGEAPISPRIAGLMLDAVQETRRGTGPGARR